MPPVGFKPTISAGERPQASRWRNYFSQLLNEHGVNDVRQTEIHTAEPIVPEPSAFEFETAIEKLKRHISPGIHQIPAELIKAGGRTIRFQISKLINSIWNKEKLPEEWKEAVILTVYKSGDKADCNFCTDKSLFLTTYKKETKKSSFEFLTPEDGPESLSRNVGKKLPLIAAQ